LLSDSDDQIYKNTGDDELIDSNFDFTEILIFDGGSAFINIWNIFVVLNALLSSYFYAFVACFGDEVETNGYFVRNLDIIFETIFFVAIVINFLKSFDDNVGTEKVKDLKRIALRYCSKGFLVDFICIFPESFIFDMSPHKFFRLLYLIKIIRISRANELFDVGKIMK
jgi:hypothetical protein